MKLSVRILMLVVLTLTLLASSPSGGMGRSAKCRNMASGAGQCPNFPYIVYYTDATKTEECGWRDSCTFTGEGCETEYKTVYFYRCCEPARKQ